TLEEHVGEAAGRGADVDRVHAGDLDPELVQRMRELVAAARDVARRHVDRELGRVLDLRPGLVEPRHAPREHERLRLRATLGEPALDEQDVQPLLHPGKGTRASEGRQRSQTDGYEVRVLSPATISARMDVSASTSSKRDCARAAAASAT